MSVRRIHAIVGVVVLAGLSGLLLAGCQPGGDKAREGAASPTVTAPNAAAADRGSARPDSAGTESSDAPDPKAVVGRVSRPVRRGDGSGDPSNEAVDRAVTAGGVAPAKEDVLMLAYSNDPDTLNAITASDTVSESFQRHVYETLADTDFADPDKLVPSLATDWKFDEEKLEYTIHLRRGVKWHPMRLPNGKMLPEKYFSARDVKFSFDCVLNKHVQAAHIRSYYEDPEAKEEADRCKIQVSVVDDYTVKVRWKKPYFMAKEFTLGGFGIIPRHVYSVDENGEPISLDFSSREFAEGFNNHWASKKMCGTGPMRFNEWTRDKRLVLDRFDGYWGHPFYFSRIVSLCIPNDNTMVQKLLQNDLDFSAVPEKDRFLQLAHDSNVEAGRVVLFDYPYPGFRYMGYNLNRDLFKDKEFRWALAYAIPVQKIIDEVFKGFAQPTTGPFLPGSSNCDNSIRPIPFDLDKARELLDKAGWKDSNDDGIRDKMIHNTRVDARMDLMIYADAPSYRTIAEIIKESYRKIGVEVLISPAKWALMLEKLNKKEFDAVISGWALSWKSDPFQLWHGSQADIPHSSNHCAYRNPELDKLIDELRVTMDEKKQIELYHKIHRILYDDQPCAFLFQDKATGGRDSRIENVKFYKIRPCVDSREWRSSKPRLVGQ